tara:strand:+ start:2500 stop:2676 length:177 start_codon:yes stop_codon:yes gene_type:complete
MYTLAVIDMARHPAAITQGESAFAIITSLMSQAIVPVAHISLVFHPGFVSLIVSPSSV